MSQAKDFINGEADAWFNRNVEAVTKGEHNTRKILETFGNIKKNMYFPDASATYR